MTPTSAIEATSQTGETCEVRTYCRICEPQCGLIATVQDGKLIKVAGNRQHPLSQGFLCRKAQAMVDITYDPDRVRQPLRRTAAGFEPCSWDEALEDIARRLGLMLDEHGPDAIATLVGNPPYFGYACAMFFGGFQAALGITRKYGVNQDDSAARNVADHLLYGSLALHPLPDLWRTQFAIVIGANPLVSKGSLVSEPRFREALDSIRERGGRVVVVDPRRSETGRRYEHLFVTPGTDAWLLLAMLNVLLREDLDDGEFLARHTTGIDRLRAAVAAFEPEVCEARCGVPASAIRELARAFAAAPSAVVYGRTGTCTQRYGTLTNVLQDLLMVVTGNIDREGGAVLGWGPIDFVAASEAAGATYAKYHTRVDKLPDVFGFLPASALARDIAAPGDDPIRALVIVGSNAVITTSGGGQELEEALQQLDLLVALDLYINETNKFADYILPVTGMYERDDFPLIPVGMSLRPSIWATRAVIEPEGEAREEWQIVDELARRMGLGGAYAAPELREIAAQGSGPRPSDLLDMMLQMGAQSDEEAFSFEKLVTEHPNGLALRATLPVGTLLQQLRTPDGKIPLLPQEIVAELEHLRSESFDEAFPLRAIGMRELGSQNSWMHNVERMMPDGRRFGARVNPETAAAAGLSDGQLAVVSSAAGEITIPVILTEEVEPATIAIPHGWGHDGGWQRANRSAGSNSNILASGRVDDLERIVGMSVFNGIPVRLDRAPQPTEVPTRG